MNCPKCDGAATEEVEVQSIKVDRCPECGGTWFEQGELGQVKDRESHGDYRWLDVNLWQDAEKVTVDEASRSKCPQDGAALATVRYGDPEIAVEVCPICFGLWLDKGEYEKIIDHLEQRVDSETLAEYLAEVEEEFVELLKGKSELSDLGKVFYLLRLRFAVEHPTLVTIKEAVRNMFPQ
ncbi:MAG: zf-TFIIB domain-containing protein [Planctomycetota bacterium]